MSTRPQAPQPLMFGERRYCRSFESCGAFTAERMPKRYAIVIIARCDGVLSCRKYGAITGYTVLCRHFYIILYTMMDRFSTDFFYFSVKFY